MHDDIYFEHNICRPDQDLCIVRDYLVDTLSGENSPRLHFVSFNSPSGTLRTSLSAMATETGSHFHSFVEREAETGTQDDSKKVKCTIQLQSSKKRTVRPLVYTTVPITDTLVVYLTDRIMQLFNTESSTSLGLKLTGKCPVRLVVHVYV